MAGRFNYPVPTSVGNIATNPSDTADTAANKGYVDSKVGGAQFLYQLQDVDVNETGRTQITLTGSPTPIDEVQNNIINIQPGVTFSGLSVNDFIAPTQTFPELVKILSITAGGAGSQNINVQGDATIWIGNGSFTNPQYQTIWKATPSINVNDVLTWNGTVWVNQAPSGGTSQSFAYREDVTYRCRTNDNFAFTGELSGDQATANITFSSAVPANTGVNNIVITFTSTIPASFVDGIPIVIFANSGLFNITQANLDVNGAVYDFDGEVNAIASSTIPIGTYAVTVNRASPVQSVEGLVDNVQFVSPDGSIAIGTDTANNAITLRSTVQGGGVSGVQGTNEGDFINANILEFLDPNGNEAFAQVGSGSGVSTNSAVIDPGVGTDGWRFNGGQTRTLISNVVAQLGAQRQRFRLTFTGTWNTQTWGAYPGVGSYQQYILRHPVFSRNNFDWEEDLDGIFPGFRPDPAVPGPSWQYLLPLTPVGYTPNRTDNTGIRWSPNNGYVPTQGQSGQLFTYLNAAGVACVNIPIGTSVNYIGFAAVSVPLKFAGSNRYVGSEFYVTSTGTGNTIPIFLAEGIAAGIALDQDLWPNADDRRLILWQQGQPPNSNQTNAIIEINLEPNRWSADSSISWPNGFPFTNATQAAARYNFTWTTEDPPGVTYSQISYSMWNQNEDSPLSPLAGASWNNRITVNLGSGGTGGGSVTSVTSALTALTFTNPTSVPQLTVQNAATPTTQFLRGDGSWQVPTISTSLQLLNNANNVINNSGTNIGVTQWTDATSGTASLINGLQVRSPALNLTGSNSGAITINVPALINPSYSLTLPAAQGTAGQTLINNGSGLLSWGAPTASLLYSDFLASARYNNTQTPIAVTANFTVPPASNVPGTLHYYVRYTSAGASQPLFRFVPTTDSQLTSLSYESFWSTYTGGVLSGLLVQKGQV